MQEKFGKKHEKLDEVQEPLPPYRFLVEGFFRLHRRRQIGEHGMQPISYPEMADFCERIMKLPADLHDFFYLAIEEIDNGVLYDHHSKSSAALEDLKKENDRKRGKKPKPRAKPRS